MILTVSISEKGQFGYLLPVQGSLSEIELVVNILNKTKEIGDGGVCHDEEVEIDFSDQEIEFLKENIKVLDFEKKLHYESLPLIKKILGS